ncbi:MAG: hypothetical protein K9K67_04395 [Bacteriovoracaceae bacterium]|nr:hypothetical protein [Bacteriovoracaceae bacterium]
MTKELLLIFITLSSFGANAALFPKDQNSTNSSLSLNAFIKHTEDWTTSLQIRLQDNEDLSDQKSIQLGVRYNLAPQWKTGLFIRKDYGLRHNEDWVWKSRGNYSWLDTKKRDEDSIIPFIQYKVRLSSFKGMAYKLRIHYRHNTFNQQEDIFFRTGFINILPANFIMINQINMTMPTNYSQRFITYYGYYFSLAWSMKPNITIGPEFSFNHQFWNESVAFRMRENDVFEVKNQNLRSGIVLNSYF